MIAFDTNHLLRHILQDDVKQCKAVAAILEGESSEGRPILIIDLVIMETCWVLTQVYDFDKEAWCHILIALLSDAGFVFEDAAKLRCALERYSRGKANFNDYLILTHAESCDAKLETFDKKLKCSM